MIVDLKKELRQKLCEKKRKRKYKGRELKDIMKSFGKNYLEGYRKPLNIERGGGVEFRGVCARNLPELQQFKIWIRT